MKKHREVLEAKKKKKQYLQMVLVFVIVVTVYFGDLFVWFLQTGRKFL